MEVIVGSVSREHHVFYAILLGPVADRLKAINLEKKNGDLGPNNKIKKQLYMEAKICVFPLTH